MNGKWVTQKCPDNKPYCKTGAGACTSFSYDDSCVADSFIPHAGSSTVYVCPVAHGHYFDQYVYTMSCSSSGCMKASTGYGVASLSAESCNQKGKARIHEVTNGYYVCQKCKTNQNGELYWLYVPAKYTIEHYSVSCTPWAE